MDTLLPQWIDNNFNALEKSINGHKSAPIHKVRKLALQLLKEKGLPTPKDEEWKYTNISEISSRNFKLPQSSAGFKLDALRPNLAGEENSPRFVFIDGKFSESLSNIGFDNQSIKGLTISTLGNVLKNADSLAGYNSTINLKDGSFDSDQAIVALNTTFAEDGLAINVSAGAVIPGFIQLVFVNSGLQEDVFTASRVLINAEKGSQLTVVESHIGSGSHTYLSAPVAEINIAENAEVNFYKIGLESDKSYHLSNIILNQERDSRSKILLFSTGGKLVRNEVRLRINGSNCNAVLNGLTVLNKEQLVDNHTEIDHAMPNSESRESIKGIYAGKAKGVFNGTIIVRKDAQKTNAYQSNQTVLLSKDASIDSKPQLKIWADDVKCTHGATVGQLDENALFYLRSRGLDLNTARNLLVQAFASQIFTEIKDENIKTFLQGKLTEKLNLIDAG